MTDTERPWSDPAICSKVLHAIDQLSGKEKVKPSEVVGRLMAALHPYDSIDREEAFSIASERFNMAYDAIYYCWLYDDYDLETR